ncbi:MAG: hypothetical protein DME45_10755 [Verrucomicrobia bacterium]|nr:MAG: hypothetical protein DME45_10755 [Verrucomicrobiota bacterium]
MIARGVFSGERTRLRVPIFDASPKCFLVQSREVVGEAPTTAREARALPRPESATSATDWPI